MGFLGSLIARVTGRHQQRVVPPTHSDDLIQSIIPTLPSANAMGSAIDESAKKLAETTKNLDVPFTPLTPLTGQRTLTDKERWWCERELEKSGLRKKDYPKNVWPTIVKAFGVQAGLYKAAESGCGEGDYTGALESWLKWISIFNETLPIEYVDKFQWLLLVQIYTGLRRANDARKALAWATAAAHAEQIPEGRSQWVDRQMQSDWGKRLDEVQQSL